MAGEDLFFSKDGSAPLKNQTTGIITGASWVQGTNFSPSDYCLSFDGTNYVSCRDVNSTPSLFDFANRNFTISCWFYNTGYVNQGSAWNCVVGRLNPFDTTGFGIVYDITNQIYFYAGNLGNNSATTGLNGWHHLLGIHDSTGLNTKIYIDGVLKNTVVYGNQMISTSDRRLLIGTEDGAFGVRDVTNGKICDVRVWNRVLTSEEVTEVFKGNNVYTGLIAWYKLDEGTGTSVKNYAERILIGAGTQYMGKEMIDDTTSEDFKRKYFS